MIFTTVLTKKFPVPYFILGQASNSLKRQSSRSSGKEVSFSIGLGLKWRSSLEASYDVCRLKYFARRRNMKMGWKK